jgi:hypothetical protein
MNGNRPNPNRRLAAMWLALLLLPFVAGFLAVALMRWVEWMR